MSVSQTLIEQIHNSGRPLVLAVTGGGSGAVSALLQVPGASASVLEAIVPYAATALADWLGGRPDQYCSEQTARAMAMAAFERARQLVAAGGSPAVPSTGEPPVATSLRGIGATASLASTRPKRGPHRIHVAWQSADTTTANSLMLTGEDSRAEEEQLATELILDAIADACGVDRPVLSQRLRNSIQRREKHAPSEWTELLLGERKSVGIAMPNSANSTKLLFPGAFNPPHAGHKRMAEVAGARCGIPVTFELSIANVDKPLLDFIEISDRLSLLQGERVLVTRAAMFVEKAELAPGSVFIVGVDTLARIGDPAYYGGDAARRNAAIESIAKSGCRFLVFGRAMHSGFCSLANVDVPTALRALCDEVPESIFREDTSSTKLRGA